MEDNSLSAFIELADGLQLSMKELMKGNMNLPMYQALYLDKVLHYKKPKVF